MTDFANLFDSEVYGVSGFDGLAAPDATSIEEATGASANDVREDARPEKGTFLDETVELVDPEGELLARQVIEILDDAKPRKRKRHGLVDAHHVSRVRAVLANGLSCNWHRESRRVSFFGGAEGYKDKVYCPDWLRGEPLAELVKAMAECHLVEATKGVVGFASSYTITNLLVAIAEAFGVSPSSLRRIVPRNRLVRTFTAKPKGKWDFWERRVKKGRGTEILFEPTAETETWTEALATYNAFISRQRLDVALSVDGEALWIEHLNADGEQTGGRFKRPDMLRTNVYRVFNDDDMDAPTFRLNGRLVGSWWMSVPKDVRKLITINGQPTVELDYKACHPRMLYHEAGLEGPTDPYDLPEVYEFAVSKGLIADECRDCTKWLMQCIINGRGRPDLAKRPDDICIPEGFPLMDMVRLIEASHRPIASEFNSGAGLRLMRDESDIALSILSTATEQGWPVLSVHDSFIATKDNEERLERLMEEVYIEKKGWKPIIN